MEFLTILNKLEENLTRKTASLKKKNNACTWTNTNPFTVTYTINNNSTTKNNVIQICLTETNNTINVYINYNNRYKYEKLPLNNITSFTVNI